MDDVEKLKIALEESRATINFLEEVCEGVISALVAEELHQRGEIERHERRADLRDCLRLLNQFSAYQLAKRLQ